MIVPAQQKKKVIWAYAWHSRKGQHVGTKTNNPSATLNPEANEGLPKPVGPKPGETGGGCSDGTRGYAGCGFAGVTSPGLSDS